ncbi:MAG: DUF4129 domain-containing protein [Thermogutta sp.]
MTLVVGLAIVLSLWGPARLSFGETGEVARDALRRGGFPWYDAENDDIKPTHIRKPPRERELGVRSPRVIYVPWSAVGIILVTLAMTVALVLGYLAWRRWRPWQGRGEGATAIVARLRELALVPEESSQKDDLLKAAERAAAAGDYRRAIIWLYAYQLTELDRHRLIRLMKGKTNRQYLRELGGQSPIRPILERTILTFEEVYFGGRALTAEKFDQCYREITRFQQSMTEIAA